MAIDEKLNKRQRRNSLTLKQLLVPGLLEGPLLGELMRSNRSDYEKHTVAGALILSQMITDGVLLYGSYKLAQGAYHVAEKLYQHF